MKEERFVYKVVNNHDGVYTSCFVGRKAHEAIMRYELGKVAKRRKGYGGLACFDILRHARGFLAYSAGERILKCKLIRKSPFKLFIPLKVLYSSKSEYNDSSEGRFAMGVDRNTMGNVIYPLGTIFCDEILPLEVVQ